MPYLFKAQEHAIPRYVEQPRFFNHAECDAIIALGQRCRQEEATVSADRHLDPTMRKTHLRWMDFNPETSWIWEKIERIAQQVNDECFHYDIIGCTENIQFTEYTEELDHYEWHTDMGDAGGMSRRKLSFVAQLSDPSEYEGGDLLLQYDRHPVTISKGLGTVVLFPSFTLHKVTPVTQGKRYSLVVWVSGLTSYK